MAVAPKEGFQEGAFALNTDSRTKEFLELQLEIRRVQEKLPLYYKFKVVNETLWAAVLISLLSIPMLFISLVILLKMGRPFVYRQLRVGKNGVPFYAYKFRTMRKDAPRVVDVGFQPLQKIIDDPRVDGRIGRFLRKYKWDELPQLFNVLKGDMLLIGPRPYLFEENFVIPKSQIGRFAVRPGISGPWQVSGDLNMAPSEKLMVDYEYANSLTYSTDVKLLIKTLRVVLFRGEN